MARYKGKYPKNIKMVSSMTGSPYAPKLRGTVQVVTNDGTKYNITAVQTGGVMPQLREDVSKYVLQGDQS